MVKHMIISSEIVVRTGLRIGSGRENLRIGDLDNPIIRDPRTGFPYIPGSSIKGKMRFLLEWRLDKVSNSGEVHQCGDKGCKICSVFGSTKYESVEGVAPTRFIVRDAFLTGKMKLGKIITEEKTENMIDRLTGKAKHPRTMERVVPGTKFSFEAVVRLFGEDEDKEKEILDVVLTGLYLLQLDYLGSSGSRGYGKIEFVCPKTTEDGKEEKLAVKVKYPDGREESRKLKDYLPD